MESVPTKKLGSATLKDNDTTVKGKRRCHHLSRPFITQDQS